MTLQEGTPPTFKGCFVVPSPQMMQWPAWLRGRAFYRLGIELSKSDEQEGAYVFAGYVLYFRIEEIAGVKTCSLFLGSDM